MVAPVETRIVTIGNIVSILAGSKLGVFLNHIAEIPEPIAGGIIHVVIKREKAATLLFPSFSARIAAPGPEEAAEARPTKI